MPHSSHFFFVSSAMAASAIDTCSAVVACAQRWCWCICSSLRLSHSVACASSLRASVSISFFSFS